jgi:hypothetical protein
VVIGTYRDLFIAVSGCAGALTGLLFVAISVAPQRVKASGPHVIQQVRAAAALLAFTNALAVSLFGLVPQTSVAYPALALSVVGLLFTAAGSRSIFSVAGLRHRLWRSQVALMFLLLAIFGTELVCAIILLFKPDSFAPVQNIGYALVGSLLVGIARAWELVGSRDTGIIASLAVLTGRERLSPLPDEDDLAQSPADGADEQHG